jgi:hypothetical protein
MCETSLIFLSSSLFRFSSSQLKLTNFTLGLFVAVLLTHQATGAVPLFVVRLGWFLHSAGKLFLLLLSGARRGLVALRVATFIALWMLDDCVDDRSRQESVCCVSVPGL